MVPDKKKRKQSHYDDSEDDFATGANSVARKKQRTYTEEDAAFAKIYDDLADEIGSVRLEAVKSLLTKLSSESKPTQEIFTKVFRRLVRGLCSGRKAARSGFFIALTEVLRFEHFKLPSNDDAKDGVLAVQSLIDAVTTAHGKPSTQEKRDHAIGRVLAYQAILESGYVLLVKDPRLLWKSMLQQMFSHAKSTPWLREEYCSVLNKSIATISESKKKKKFLQDMLAALVEHKLEKTPEGVALWLTTRSNSKKIAFPEKCWHKDNPLDRKDRPKLISAMKGNRSDNTSDAKDQQASRSGSNQTRMSFAWTILLSEEAGRLFRKETEPVERAKKFAGFWNAMVDDVLFADSASPERKRIGLQLLADTIVNGASWTIPLLFSPNAMRCIVNQRSHAERLLHDSAALPLAKLNDRVKIESDHQMAAAIMESVIKTARAVNFDLITKTKTIQNIISGAPAASLESILDLIVRLIHDPTAAGFKEGDTENVRQSLANLLLMVVRNRDLEASDESAERVLLVAMKYSFSDSRIAPQPPISASSREVFRARLMSCITHLMLSQTEALTVCTKIIAFLKDLRESKDQELLLRADENIQENLRQAISMVETLAQGGPLSPISTAFVCLYTTSILQIHNEDPDAVPLLEEIDAAYKSISNNDNTVKEAFELLIEVLLSMVAKRSALFRRLGEQTFTVLASELTNGALHSMLDILAQKENVAGQQALFEQNDVDEVEMEGVGNNESVSGLDGSDVEIVDGGTLSGSAASESEKGEDTDGDEGSDIAGQEDEEEMKRLDASLGELLKTGRLEGNESATDDESMDDEQMMALEPKLVKIFQERQKTNNKKEDNKEAKENMINFKNRVLDLLLIYTKQQHANPLSLDLVLPLLKLISETTSTQIADRSVKLLQQYFGMCGKKKDGLPKPEETEAAWEILATLLDEVGKDPSKKHQSACSQASLFLVKVIAAAEQESASDGRKVAMERAQDMFSDLQKRWMANQKLELQLSFFQNWLGWCSDIRKGK
ncbi:MAG: DNA-directed DNA polymerase [Bogoriella megaspora]|nr:MAG: DNA-directed DNA polymerase [Bogoriella megaspora]